MFNPRGSQLIVPVILSVVAVAQLTLGVFSTLTPWRGGGFGMFASVDGPHNRYISVVGFDGFGHAHTIDIPWEQFRSPEPLTSRFARRTLAFPTEHRLQRIAEAVLDADLEISARPDVPPMTLLDSPYQAPLAASLRQGVTVDVVGPFGRPGSALGLLRVEARVLMLDFNVETGRAFFRQLGAHGTGRSNALSARK